MSENGTAGAHATMDVQSLRVARVYAEGLLNAAAKQGLVRQVLDELDSLVTEVFTHYPGLEAFLGSGAVSRDQKDPVIQKVFQGRASELFTNLLLVLNRHDRLDLLRLVRVAAHDIDNERNKRMRVKVRSAVSLSETQRDRLRQELRQSFQWEPLLEATVDADLLGGMTVQVGDWMYDASVRTRLQRIQNLLIENSSHEIQSGRDRFRSADGD
jgi:F-type H+-transporting ATPase subunit delta